MPTGMLTGRITQQNQTWIAGRSGMDIEWINEKYKEANRVFDSPWEAREWGDSLYPDFAGGLRPNVGYATPDHKVYVYLLEHLPKWALYNNVQIEVHTSLELVDEKMLYRLWVTPSND
jgi:hypothetical protein